MKTQKKNIQKFCLKQDITVLATDQQMQILGMGGCANTTSGGCRIPNDCTNFIVEDEITGFRTINNNTSFIVEDEVQGFRTINNDTNFIVEDEIDGF